MICFTRVTNNILNFSFLMMNWSVFRSPSWALWSTVVAATAPVMKATMLMETDRLLTATINASGSMPSNRLLGMFFVTIISKNYLSHITELMLIRASISATPTMLLSVRRKTIFRCEK